MHNFLNIVFAAAWTGLEIVLLIAIFLLQVYVVYLILDRIRLFKGIFDPIPDVNPTEDGNSLFQLDFDGSNKTMNTIVENVNSYLSKNVSGFIDFNIIRDIIDRNVDNVEEEIANKISAPLYLGLAGTMIGIVIGLMSLDLSATASTSGGSSVSFNALIEPLIQGVKYAMMVSVIGLIATTVLSVYVFRVAKATVNGGKNLFLSKLQNELLPELVQSDEQVMRKMTTAIETFNFQAPSYVSELKKTSDNLLTGLKLEQFLLKEIQELDIKKVAGANASVFKELSKMMDDFKAFGKYYNKLNTSLKNTVALNENLENMVARTEDVNTVLREVKQIVETGQEATTFFNAHIESFEKYGASVNNAVAQADSQMHTAINQLNKAVTGQFEAFEKGITSYDQKLSNAFENSIEQFNSVYSNSVPKFEQLDHLKPIEQHLIEMKVLDQRFEKLQEQMQQQQNSIDAQTRALKEMKIDVKMPDNLELDLPEQKKSVKERIMEGLVIGMAVAVIGYIVFDITSKSMA